MPDQALAPVHADLSLLVHLLHGGVRAHVEEIRHQAPGIALALYKEQGAPEWKQTKTFVLKLPLLTPTYRACRILPVSVGEYADILEYFVAEPPDV